MAAHQMDPGHSKDAWAVCIAALRAGAFQVANEMLKEESTALEEPPADMRGVLTEISDIMKRGLLTEAQTRKITNLATQICRGRKTAVAAIRIRVVGDEEPENDEVLCNFYIESRTYEEAMRMTIELGDRVEKHPDTYPQAWDHFAIEFLKHEQNGN